MTTDAETTAPGKRGEGPTYKTALLVTALCILHALILAVVSVVITLRYPTSRQTWANFLGIMAALLASIQYFPQIYTTLRLRCVGSLSIPMMCFQTPGGFLWAASLAVRVGKEGWSTWAVFLLTASLQGVLLFMALYFELFSPKDGVHPHGAAAGRPPKITRDDDPHEQHIPREEYPDHANGQPSEETPLLRDP